VTPLPVVEHYRFGAITVDGERHTKDLIILPERVISDWWRKEGHSLSPDDLKAVFEAAPETLVVGTGAYGMMRVTEEARHALEEAKVRLIVAPTPKAVDAYNELREETRVAAALHLTC